MVGLKSPETTVMSSDLCWQGPMGPIHGEDTQPWEQERRWLDWSCWKGRSSWCSSSDAITTLYIISKQANKSLFLLHLIFLSQVTFCNNLWIFLSENGAFEGDKLLARDSVFDMDILWHRHKNMHTIIQPRNANQAYGTLWDWVEHSL